jgi:hypothetical protein
MKGVGVLQLLSFLSESKFKVVPLSRVMIASLTVDSSVV